MTRTHVLGLTGSIGMGKSTTARLFAEAGIPVWDADQAVHQLYGAGGAAVAPVARLCPQALKKGGIDREALKRWIARDPTALGKLEAEVHPLVAQARAAFLRDARLRAVPLVVLDIPLLFETGADAHCDSTLVVTAPLEIQKARVLARPGMTEERFQTILDRQMPDARKRARADHIILSVDLDSTRAAVHSLIRKLTGEG